MRNCHIDQTACPDGQPCPACQAAFEQRPAASTMSAAERQQELARLLGPLELPFDLVHQRIEELVGRPVWTHELAQPQRLLAELG